MVPLDTLHVTYTNSLWELNAEIFACAIPNGLLILSLCVTSKAICPEGFIEHILVVDFFHVDFSLLFADFIVILRVPLYDGLRRNNCIDTQSITPIGKHIRKKNSISLLQSITAHICSNIKFIFSYFECIFTSKKNKLII